MDDSKFNNFMADVLENREIASPANAYWDAALGVRKDEIIALYTERNISKRSIFDSLVKAGIIGEERTHKAFANWMGQEIKKNNEAANAEPEKAVSVNSAKISIKE